MEIVAACFNNYSPKVYTCDGMFAVNRTSLALYLLTNLVKINFHFSHFENFLRLRYVLINRDSLGKQVYL